MRYILRREDGVPRMTDDTPSLLLPAFARRLSDPSIRTVLLCGCGGGFDFVHSLALYPELVRLGKAVVLGSYSFGDPRRIGGDAPVVFEEAGAVVKRVTAASVPDPYYGPEVHACSFLDGRYPGSSPHSAYAYYARAFTVPLLRRLYGQLVREHAVDAAVLVDGGSDSLMAGDEEGLGDPIEDAVSVAAVASLGGLRLKALISVGLGADRYNQVSDAASLRAVAELTRAGGFLGALGLEPDGPPCASTATACGTSTSGRASARSWPAASSRPRRAGSAARRCRRCCGGGCGRGRPSCGR
jgi:Protein of unknown function (DUF1152)